MGIEWKRSGKIIGMLEIFDVENDRLGKVGYRIALWLWGQGICTEALHCAIVFIFSETTLDRLEVTADVRNIGSNSVLKK